MTMAQGLVVAITGSGQGIGRALARSFAREGAHVVVADIDAAACQTTADELATLGVPADITRADDCAALVAKTVAAFGRLDVMVCNAGIMQLKPLLELDGADWDRMLGVNVKGSFLTLQAAARHMLTQVPLADGRPRGKIIMMASIAGRLGAGAIAAVIPHYRASKAGVISLTQSAAIALAPQITVNAICPGLVESDMWQRMDRRPDDELNPMTHPAEQLKRLLAAGAIVQAPGAYDALSARLVQRADFEAIYMTGFGATASRLGQPDIGLLTQTEMTTHAREYVQAGVAAIHLEDQVAPKRCGQMAGIRLIDARENERRLRCALQARGADPLLIIGRTDALPAVDIDEAVARALRYPDAGVDLVFVDGIKRMAEVEAVARRVPGPKVVSIVDGTDAAGCSATELQAMGFAIVFHAVTALFAAARAVEQALAALRMHGTPSGLPQPGMSYAAFCDVVGLAPHQRLDEAWGAPT